MSLQKPEQSDEEGLVADVEDHYKEQLLTGDTGAPKNYIQRLTRSNSEDSDIEDAPDLSPLKSDLLYPINN